VKKIFFDTWGWVAIANKNDPFHGIAGSFYRTFLLNKGIPVTTDYVLSETITLSRTRMAADRVAIFMDAIIHAVKTGKIMLEKIDEKRWEKSWELSKKYNDKPSISFVDFTSFVVMKDTGVLEVLTADSHFEEVGLRFKKLF
jgi:predicted nucleic acid-binding protein